MSVSDVGALAPATNEAADALVHAETGAKGAAKNQIAKEEEPMMSLEIGLATELLSMGFEQKSVELVLEKNRELPSAELLEACTRDLVQLSEWDSMLIDLEEMGFDNRELNTRLMVKNNGSVKRTVKDLVTDGN